MVKKDLKQLDNTIKQILNVSHDAIVVSDEMMSIIYINKVAINLFGYSEEEFIGMKIINLLPERKKENYIRDHQSIKDKIVVSNVKSDEEFFAKKKDGSEFHIELTWLIYTGKNDNKYNIAQIRDISKRKVYEKNLLISNRSLRIISECNKALVNAENEINYFEDICNIIVSNGGYKIAWIGIVKYDETQSIEPVAYQGLEKGHFEDEIAIKGRMSWKLREEKNTGPTALAVNSKKVTYCNNIQGDPKYGSWREEAKNKGYNSSISMPLIVDEKVEAVLIILSKNTKSCDKEETKFLEQLSDDISFGIKTLRLKEAQRLIEDHLKMNEERLLLSNMYLRVISQSNKVLAKANTSEEYLEDICKIIVNTGGHLRSLIQRINYGESVTIDTLAIYGNSLGEYDKDLPLLQNVKIAGLTETCVREKRPLVSQNIIGSGNYRYWSEDPNKIKFQSAVVIPMIKNDKVIGTLRVFSKDPFSYNSKELGLLQDLANDIMYGIDIIESKKEKKFTENKLSESEEKYKNLFQNSNDAIFLADAETGIIIDANKKAGQLLDISTNDIIGMHQTELHPLDQSSKYQELFNAHLASKKKIDEFYIVDKSGKHIPVHVSASVATINGKKVLQGIFRDISETKKEEDKLRQSQKMEALGTLSGGIAHDFNNILSPIIGYSELMKIENNPDKRSHYLNEVLNASNRAKDLVKQILTFCRKGESEMKPFKIQLIVKEVLKLIKMTIPSNIEMEVNINPNCGMIMCDPTKIHQIIMNLCTNAAHAMMETGGKLKVSLVDMLSEENSPDDIERLNYDKYICLIVEDSGCGMTKSTMDRIFEPYYTTKNKDEGTGLGLSVVLGIVKEHGGDIYVRSIPDEGSYFKVTFPLLDEILVKDEHKKELIKGGSERILIVDDEQILSEIISAILNDLGYKTTQFNNSTEALKEFKNNPNKYDLIFTDQTMPGMLGSDLAKKILEIRKDIPIILCTGYSPLITKEEALKIGIKEFVMKPITMLTLGTVVRRVIDDISNE